MGFINNDIGKRYLLYNRVEVRHEHLERSYHYVELVQLRFLSDSSLVGHISEVPFPISNLFSSFSTIRVIV
jgi:hypothetical protein